MYKLHRWDKGSSQPEFTEQDNLRSSPVDMAFVRTAKKGIDYLMIPGKHL